MAVLARNERYLSNSRFFAETEHVGNTAVLHCSGRLCFQGEAQELAQIAQELLSSGRDLVLDLAALTLLDSAGIGQLVFISMYAQALGRDVCLACAPDRVRRLLELTNVASLFEFFASVDDALESCASNAA